MRHVCLRKSRQCAGDQTTTQAFLHEASNGKYDLYNDAASFQMPHELQGIDNQYQSTSHHNTTAKLSSLSQSRFTCSPTKKGIAQLPLYSGIVRCTEDRQLNILSMAIIWKFPFVLMKEKNKKKTRYSMNRQE